MSTQQDTILEVQGMSCPSCVRHINTALGELLGVQQVDVKLQEGVVIVKHDASLPIKQLIEALEEAGYASQPSGTRD